MKAVLVVVLAIIAICNGNVLLSQLPEVAGKVADSDGVCNVTTHEGRQCVSHVISKFTFRFLKLQYLIV